MIIIVILTRDSMLMQVYWDGLSNNNNFGIRLY